MHTSLDVFSSAIWCSFYSRRLNFLRFVQPFLQFTIAFAKVLTWHWFRGGSLKWTRFKIHIPCQTLNRIFTKSWMNYALRCCFLDWKVFSSKENSPTRIIENIHLKVNIPQKSQIISFLKLAFSPELSNLKLQLMCTK